MTDRRSRAPWLVVATAVAVFLQLLRQKGARSWRTIWAEDGWLYFQQAHDDGLAVLLRGFAGYLQLPTRLLAAPSPLLPIEGLALYLALTSAIVGALLGWFLYWATEGWITDRTTRIALAALTAVMPALGLENLANLTNHIWLLVGVAPWAFLARHDSRRAVVLRSGVAFAAASASLLSIVILPVAAATVVARRSRASWTVATSYVLGLVLQMCVVVSTDDERPLLSTRVLADLPEIISIRLFGQYLLGDRGIEALWDARWLVVLGPPFLVLVVLAATGRGATRDRWLVAAGLTVLAIVLLVVPVWGRGTNHSAVAYPEESLFGPLENAGDYNPNPARFSVAPVLTLAGAIAVLVASDHRPLRWRRWLVAAFAIHLAVVAAYGFRVTNARSAGPEWRSTVEAARDRCQGLSADEQAELALPEPFFNPPVVVSCRELTG